MRIKRKVEMRGGNGLTGRERDDDRRAAGTGTVGGHKQWVSDGEELITNVSNLLKTEKNPKKREMRRKTRQMKIDCYGRRQGSH